MSNLVDLVDQAAFVVERATGTRNLVQSAWMYNRAIDMAGLRQFHQHLQQGRLSRRIERSRLPFGRHRWVTPSDQSELEIATPRPRAEFDAWLDEQANSPVDAEHGPGWKLAVLPFTDGGAGVTLVVSHTLTDGVGLVEALGAAAAGREDPIRWPAAGSRRRWKAVRADARQTARDVPAMGRAVVAAARFARRNRGAAGSSAGLPSPVRSPFVGPDENITLAKATIFVDGDDWDVCARALGGTSNALLAGLAAGLAQRVGRVTTEGLATLVIPVNERVDGDTRANALTAVEITVDATAATTDLRAIRAATKQALIRRKAAADERMALLALTPLLPQWLVRRMVGLALGGPTTSGSSHVGALDPAVNRPDGTDADYLAMRNFVPGLTKATVHPTGGLLGVTSARVHGRVFVTVQAYQPDRLDSNNVLQQHISSILDELSLTATIGWPCPAAAANNKGL